MFFTTKHTYSSMHVSCNIVVWRWGKGAERARVDSSFFIHPSLSNFDIPVHHPLFICVMCI